MRRFFLIFLLIKDKEKNIAKNWQTKNKTWQRLLTGEVK